MTNTQEKTTIQFMRDGEPVMTYAVLRRQFTTDEKYAAEVERIKALGDDDHSMHIEVGYVRP